MPENLPLSLLASVVFHLVLLTILFIIAALSRIMGEALKKKPLYKLMYLAYSFLAVGLILAFFGNNFHLYVYVFDVLGLTLGSLVTFYYWKWLPADLARG